MKIRLLRGRRAAPIYALSALLAWAPNTAAQTANDEIDDSGPAVPAVLEAVALGSDAEIRLDGLVDEEAWARAAPITDFTQQDPVEGGMPSQRTEVRVTFDEDHLYIGVVLYDDPEGILAFQKRRDAFLVGDDRFQWVLDTFLDGRTGYFFEINANGMMGDALITGNAVGGGGGGGGFGGGGGGGGDRGGGVFMNRAWDGIWEAQTARRPDGWSAEIRIPFRTLNFDPDLDTWGINFQRSIRRNNEEILWRGYRRNEGLSRVIHAGRLTGLGRPSQGLGIEATPYLVSHWRTQREEAEGTADYSTTYPSDIGLDIGYSITPSLRAALSVNTDFAEVGVDQRQVNLTRFALRFPEQRGFFLEGSGVFQFLPGTRTSPYYSRRIGLQRGEQIPVTYGARLGGQVGAFELGLLHVQTGDVNVGVLDDDGDLLEVPSETFSVARVKRRFLEQSSIGGIYTRRATSGNSLGETLVDRHTAGVDAEFRTSHFLGTKNLSFRAYTVWNSNPEPEVERSFGDLSARGVELSYPNDLWSANLLFKEFGDDYDPEMGFVTRRGFRQFETRGAWRPRPRSISWLRRFDFSANLSYLADLATGVVEERELRLGLLNLDFESGDRFNVNLSQRYEYLDRTFEVSEGIEIQQGRYSTWELSVGGGTAGRRKVSLFGFFNAGQFWNGDRLGSFVGVNFRPSPGVSLGANYGYNDISLPQGDFSTNLIRLDGGWDVSPWMSVTGNVQYDDVSDVAGVYLLGRWIINPGNDLYLVFTHNWQNLAADPLVGRFDREFVTLSRGASIKLNYAYRL